MLSHSESVQFDSHANYQTKRKQVQAHIELVYVCVSFRKAHIMFKWVVKTVGMKF